MAPLELYEKIYVNAAFFETDHGQISCLQCHGGDPKETNWQTTHRGLVKDPTSEDPQAICGECYEEIVATAPHSLHYTVAPIRSAIKSRTSVSNTQILLLRPALGRRLETRRNAMDLPHGFQIIVNSASLPKVSVFLTP